jgi:hypothetical protein
MRPVRRRVLVSVGAVLLLAAFQRADLAFAQRIGPALGSAPFATFSLALAAVANVNRTSFHDLWEPSAGGEIAAGTPFYLGAIELGAERMRFDGRGAAPDYRAWFFYLGWGVPVGLLRTLHWEPGLRIGSYSMRFDGPEIPDDRRTESELGAEAVSRLVWRFAPAWDLLLTGRYRAVFTEPEIRHAFVAAGVRRSFSAPRWLREFLD